MHITNPKFKLISNNIFELREIDYSSIESNILDILKVAEEYGGFSIKEFKIRDSKINSSELAYTLKKVIIIQLEKGVDTNKIIDLSMSIPEIIDKNYIFINGRRKIPLFQLFDIPQIYRRNIINIRTNICSITILVNEEYPRINISFNGKVIPFANILCGYYSKDEIKNLLDFEFNQGNINLLKQDIERNFERNLDQDDFIKEVGSLFCSQFQKVRGEDILYALEILLKCDIISSKLLKTDNILIAIINCLKQTIDDKDVFNKRIRCWEYIVTSRISKAIYDLCTSNRRTTKPKFNVNSSQIINACNVSNIVQHDFCINPIEELTKLSRCTLVGPGGFSKENVPYYLRDINDSYFGRICPVDTPDRENCGVQQSLLPNYEYDENLQFCEKRLEDTPISVAISMVPFMEHDDQTRLQMAASQMRQAIMLQNFDTPLIKSGCEHIYSKYTSFCHIAKRDGKVMYYDGRLLIVKYDNDDIDIFKTYCRNTYVDNIDIMKVFCNIGDIFKKGDILAESYYMKDGSICFGKNLLTGVVTYYGYNYEDGIVISDKLVKEGKFTSIHYKDLSFMIPPNKILLSLNDQQNKFLPNILETVKVNKPYAIIKEMSTIEPYSVFKQQEELLMSKTTTIIDCNIYVNDYCDIIPEYRRWVQKTVQLQREKENSLQNLLHDVIGRKYSLAIIRKYNLNKFSATKHKIKGEEFSGIYVELSGFYIRPIQVGDKVGNRHGNKGVISKIIPDEKMPQLEDGRRLEIIINSMGFISRMNTGQQFELHMSMSVQDLKNTGLNMLYSGKSQDELKSLFLKYIDIIDSSETRWYYNQFKDNIDKIMIDEDFINKFTIIQSPFESVNLSNRDKAMKYTNSDYSSKLYDPISMKKFQNSIAIGYNYFFKMTHIAEEKMSFRGVGKYNRRTLQPSSGKKMKGGQRLGEMEIHSLIAMEALNNLDECITTKSDCVDKKNKLIAEKISGGTTLYLSEEEEFSEKGESINLFEAYLKQIGIQK